jgi:hypothetical protein
MASGIEPVTFRVHILNWILPLSENAQEITFTKGKPTIEMENGSPQ